MYTAKRTTWDSTASVDKNRSELDSDNLVPRVLSRGCVSDCTIQAPFGKNELYRFNIGRLCRVRAEEPNSINVKWASKALAYSSHPQNPLDTLLVSTG